MKKISFLFLILIASVSVAQNEKSENKIATESFVKNYNSENYKDIFSNFSFDMQRTLPLEKLSGFLSDLKNDVGKIKNRRFVEYKNGTSASYRTEFERGVFTIYISLDNDLKINGLYIKPIIVNNISNTNSVLTKEQSEILFEKAKIFPNQTQIALAIINNGEIGFYGIKQNNYAISSIENTSSLFEIGSISKVFTATLLAGFAVDNKLKLDAFINDYLPFPIKNQKKITFKQLANHTAGLPRNPPNLNMKSDPTNPFKNYDETKLKYYLQEELDTNRDHGSKYEYSNLGAGLLGYALSKYSNFSYEKMLQIYIFSKYKMLDSTSDRKNIKKQLIIGLDKDGIETSNFDLSILAGAGGILSNVKDLARFIVAQFDNNNEKLKLTRLKTYKISDNSDIGLGWHIFNSKSKNVWFGHSGGTGGYKSSIVFEPIHKNGIIILSNVSAHNSNERVIDLLSFELMKTLEISITKD